MYIFTMYLVVTVYVSIALYVTISEGSTSHTYMTPYPGPLKGKQKREPLIDMK
jgi:hypothetical protein